MSAVPLTSAIQQARHDHAKAIADAIGIAINRQQLDKRDFLNLAKEACNPYWGLDVPYLVQPVFAEKVCSYATMKQNVEQWCDRTEVSTRLWSADSEEEQKKVLVVLEGVFRRMSSSK